MSLSQGLYLQTDILCLVIMAILGYNSRKQLSRLFDERLFLELILSICIMIVSDVVWSVVDGRNPELFRWINVAFSGIYLFMTAFIGLMWIVFVDYKINHESHKNGKLYAIYSIPALILFFVTLISTYSGLLYYIDESNCYHRGKWHFLQALIGFGYLITATVISLKGSKKAKNRQDRKSFRALALYAFFPVMGGFLQLLIQGMPLSCVGVTLSALLVYIGIQNKQIAKDALTGINNRRQLNLYLDMIISEHNSDAYISLILIDVDKFKSINDTLGHLEGDNALMRVADLLEDVCDKRNDFLARYGGDEFAIVCVRKNSGDVDKLKNDIAEAVKKQNREGDYEYTLSLSMGSADFFTDGLNTQDAVTAAADKHLYEHKNGKRKINV